MILSFNATRKRLASPRLFFFLPTFATSLGKHFLEGDVILKFAYDTKLVLQNAVCYHNRNIF